MTRSRQTARKSTNPSVKRYAKILETKMQTRSSAQKQVGQGIGKSLVKVAPKKRFRPGMLALREIRRFQATTNLLIKRLPFQRLVRDITMKISSDGIRYKVEALSALQVNKNLRLFR